MSQGFRGILLQTKCVFLFPNPLALMYCSSLMLLLNMWCISYFFHGSSFFWDMLKKTATSLFLRFWNWFHSFDCSSCFLRPVAWKIRCCMFPSLGLSKFGHSKRVLLYRRAVCRWNHPEIKIATGFFFCDTSSTHSLWGSRQLGVQSPNSSVACSAVHCRLIQVPCQP